MGGNTHEQPATVAADATENTVAATNEIAPETENPTTDAPQGETPDPQTETEG